jgi:hypothetical protein
MCLIGLKPLLILSTCLVLISKPKTLAPPSTKARANGRPTYPIPIIPTNGDLPWFFLIFLDTISSYINVVYQLMTGEKIL